MAQFSLPCQLLTARNKEEFALVFFHLKQEKKALQCTSGHAVCFFAWLFEHILELLKKDISPLKKSVACTVREMHLKSCFIMCITPEWIEA